MISGRWSSAPRDARHWCVQVENVTRWLPPIGDVHDAVPIHRWFQNISHHEHILDAHPTALQPLQRPDYTGVRRCANGRTRGSIHVSNQFHRDPLGSRLMEQGAIVSDATHDFVNQFFWQFELHQVSESHHGVLRMRRANAEQADNLITGFSPHR